MRSEVTILLYAHLGLLAGCANSEGVYGYAGLVDHVYFRGGLTGFSIDDLTYDTVSSVPLPASWAMFAGGAALLGFTRRRMTATV